MISSRAARRRRNPSAAPQARGMQDGQGRTDGALEAVGQELGGEDEELQPAAHGHTLSPPTPSCNVYIHPLINISIYMFHRNRSPLTLHPYLYLNAPDTNGD